MNLRNLLLVFVLGVSLLFVLAGIGMIATGNSAGATVLLFFGACSAVFVWQLKPSLFERGAPSLESLLLRYPEPVVLRSAPTKLLFLAGVSLIFGGAILWMLLREPLSILMQILLWPGVVLFLGGAVLQVWIAFKGASLHLEKDGFEFVQAGRRHAMRWSDVGEFEPIVVPGSTVPMVMFDNAALEKTRLDRINKTLTGRNSALPDTYGLTAVDLAILMNLWRLRAPMIRPSKTPERIGRTKRPGDLHRRAFHHSSDGKRHDQAASSSPAGFFSSSPVS